mgnify:CR=1 FL=1
MRHERGAVDAPRLPAAVGLGQQVVARVTIEREGGDRPACVAETVSVVVF